MGLKGFIKTVFGSGPNHHGRFRALVIGRAGCGKTSILDRFCGENISDMPGESRGLHKIGKELMSKNNPSFVAHDSRGTEAGSDEEFETVMSFIEERSRMGPLHRIHVIWYCIPIGDRAIQEAEKKFFSGNRFNIPVIAIVTKYDLLIEECQQIIEEDWENDPAFDPSQNDQLEDLSAQARTAARRVFHTHYQDKLMRMPFPPESVVRLANVHINKNSKELLHDLNLATLRAIKDTDTDVLMVFARAQKIDESLPSFFALLSYHIYERPKIKKRTLTASANVGTFTKATPVYNDPTTFMTFWAPENYEIAICDALAEFVDSRSRDCYKILSSQGLQERAFRAQVVCDLWIVLQSLGKKREKLEVPLIRKAICAYGKSEAAKEVQRAIIDSCNPLQWAEWKSFWQIYEAVQQIARHGREQFAIESQG